MKEELVIVAHITVKAECKNDVMDAFKAVIAGTRKEEGNISYVLHEHTDNPLKFTLVEAWKSQAAIDIHNKTEHFLNFVKAIEGKADLEIYVMKEVL